MMNSSNEMSTMTTQHVKLSAKVPREWFQAFDVCPHRCCYCYAFGPLLKDVPWVSIKEGSSIVLFRALRDLGIVDQ